MDDLFGLPGVSGTLPLAVVVGALLVSRLLRVSLIGSLIGAAAPLFLPFEQIPFIAKNFGGAPRLFLLSGAWGALVCAALAWSFARPYVSRGVASVGPLRLVYMFMLAAAAGVAALLIVNPVLLSEHLPHWRGTAGVVLLTASCVGMSAAFARVLRAAVFLGVWSFVSLTLASELVFHKLPYHLNSDDLLEIRGYLPAELADGAGEALRSIARVGSTVLGYVSGGGALSVARMGASEDDDQGVAATRRGRLQGVAFEYGEGRQSVGDART